MNSFSFTYRFVFDYIFFKTNWKTEIPQKGISFDQGKDVAVIESVKAASEIYSPASGEIIETNSSLEENPEIINDDPLVAGWLYKIKIINKEELKNLMNEEEYNKLIGV